jgi:ABC-2 type transport system permease protein
MLRYLWLEARRQWRDREVLVFRLGLPTAIYLMLTVVGDSAGESSAGLPRATARMVAIAALGAVISGLAAGPSLGEERANGWLRQLRTTPLAPRAVVAAKIAVAMSFALPSIALVVAAAAVTDGTALTLAQQVVLVGIMWLATIPVTALGTLIGLTFKAEAAQGATTMAFVVLWLLGGIFTSPSNMPDALAAIATTLPSYGITQIGWSLAGGDPIPPAATAVAVAWTLGGRRRAALAWRHVSTR